MSENVVFREKGVFGKMPILHPSAVLGRNPPTKYSQIFLEVWRGGQKTGKKQCFLVVSCAVFVFYIVSSWSPVVLTNLLACKCVIHRWCLTFHVMCFPSFRWLCFLVSIHLYFSWVHIFSFGCLSFLSSLLVGQKPRWNHKISPNFHCHLLLRCLHPHTFTWPR